MWQVLTSDDSVMYRHHEADVLIMGLQRGRGRMKQCAHASHPPSRAKPTLFCPGQSLTLSGSPPRDNLS